MIKNKVKFKKLSKMKIRLLSKTLFHQELTKIWLLISIKMRIFCQKKKKFLIENLNQQKTKVIRVFNQKI